MGLWDKQKNIGRQENGQELSWVPMVRTHEGVALAGMANSTPGTHKVKLGNVVRKGGGTIATA